VARWHTLPGGLDPRPTDQSPSRDREETVRARGIYAETVRTFAGRAGFLLALGALVFIPLGLLDAFADRIGSIHVSSPGELTSLALAAAVVGFAAQAITSLLGEVFYSGAVALTLANADSGERPTLWQVARSLSYGRLIAVDILFGAVVVIGLVALIAPGVLAFTWFALAGPLVEIEDCGTKEAFTRSRALVRGHFWTVVAVLGPITLASEFAADAVLTLSHGAIHNPLLGAWVGESVTNIAISPFYAVAAVLLTLKLRRRAV
jgi:hypothetical protein